MYRTLSVTRSQLESRSCHWILIHISTFKAFDCYPSSPFVTSLFCAHHRIFFFIFFFLGFWMSVEAQVSDAARDEGLKSALLNVAGMWVLSINDQQHCDSLNSLRSEHHRALLRCLSPPFPQSFELDWAPPLSCTCYLCITDLRLWLRRSSIQRPCHEYQPFSILNDIPLTLSPHACEIVCFLCTCCITSFPYNSLQAVDATEQLVLKSVCW